MLFFEVCFFSCILLNCLLIKFVGHLNRHSQLACGKIVRGDVRTKPQNFAAVHTGRTSHLHKYPIHLYSQTFFVAVRPCVSRIRVHHLKRILIV